MVFLVGVYFSLRNLVSFGTDFLHNREMVESAPNNLPSIEELNIKIFWSSPQVSSILLCLVNIGSLSSCIFKGSDGSSFNSTVADQQVNLTFLLKHHLSFPKRAQ